MKKKDQLEKKILELCQAKSIQKIEQVQELWSGYGKIQRYFLEEGNYDSIIVKHIEWPNANKHPRGWNTNASHQRKVKSYDVEMNWYLNFSEKCSENCRAPKLLHHEKLESGAVLILEDLNASGFTERKQQLSALEVNNCLKWLAWFHGRFMNSSTSGLWKTGTYWHLQTRAEEWERMSDGSLKQTAQEIDEKLSNCTFQTLVHGDAKVANFCFTKNGEVSAVDFQYVGGGYGMKDIAYFLGSCLSEEECKLKEKNHLNFYFLELKKSLLFHQKEVDFEKLEQEWRELYPFAWADFQRFLDGWMPGHWKINAYTEKMCQLALHQLKTNS